jgi:hypothetical protein
MNIQTISIVVPTKGCVNNCPFCCSKMHDCPYENKWNDTQMRKRIQYAVMNGVNTCIITGTGEAMQNVRFLENLSSLFMQMDNPFPNVEIQTTGVFLSMFELDEDDHKPIYTYINLLTELGVNTVSLSVSDIFFDKLNMDIIGVKSKLQFRLGDLIPLLKSNGFNIRLSLNMLEHFNNVTPLGILSRCQELGANQVTFRKMYRGEEDIPENVYVSEKKCSDQTLENIQKYIEGYMSPDHTQKFISGHGTFLYRLPFGGKVYSIMGMSTVMDDDCMSKESNDSLKYVILRENGKLYCRWDDEGSLIF